MFELHKYDNITDTKGNVRHIIKIFKKEKNNLEVLTPEVDIDEKFKELVSPRSDLFSAFHEAAKEVWKKDYKKNKAKFISKLQEEVKIVKEISLFPEEKAEESKKLPIKKVVNEKLSNDKYIEAVEGGFLMYNEGKIEFWPFLTHNNFKYLPKVEIHEIPYKPYQLVNKDNIDLNKLRDKVYSVFDDFLEAPAKYKITLTSGVFLTYQLQKFESTPYFVSQGEKGTGKTRVLEIFELLGYRPMLSTDIPVANVFQYLHDTKYGIILDDELDASIDKSPEKRAIYKSGYRKSGKTPRISIDSTGKRVQIFYPTYGFKGFTVRSELDDDHLLDRCVPFKMVRGEPKYGGFSKDDEARFQEIRNELLLWKVKTWKDDFEIKRASNREDELFDPLITIAEMLDLDTEAILEMRKSLVKDKQEIIRARMEAKVVAALCRCMITGKDTGVENLNNDSVLTELYWTDIWTTLVSVLGGKIKEGRIEAPDYKYPVYKNRVQKILRTLKGTKSQHKNTRTYIFSIADIRSHIKTYALAKEDYTPEVRQRTLPIADESKIPFTGIVPKLPSFKPKK